MAPVLLKESRAEKVSSRWGWVGSGQIDLSVQLHAFVSEAQIRRPGGSVVYSNASKK